MNFLASCGKFFKLSIRRLTRFSLLKSQLRDSDYDIYSRVNRYLTLAWLAIIGFPLYYLIWSYAFPQPYENLGLRVFGMVLGVPLLFARRFYQKKWFSIYFYVAFTYAFPFFFTFMYFMNQGSSVWSQSVLIAIFVMLHLEFRLALISTFAGVGLAYAAYVFTTHQFTLNEHTMYTNIPIMLFAVVAISIVKVGRRLLADEKLQGMSSALATVSHELRTPLLSVGATAQGLKRYLPTLVEFYTQHAQQLSQQPLPGGRLDMLVPAIGRIQTEVQYMNSAIDLLLANAGKTHGKAQVVQRFSINELVDSAIARYPFENDHQRALVSRDFPFHFDVTGNQDLCLMVIFNLMKNALRALARAGKGSIVLITQNSSAGPRLIVRDSGCGIPAHQLAHIFQRFHSYPQNASTGIGLAFCRSTLAAWGARIDCESVEGEGTDFIIHFN